MRCLSIADALFSLGEEVIFYTSDEFAEQTITKRGFKAIRLHYAWNDKESELNQLSGELEKNCPRLLLIDSYQVTKQYLKSLRQSVKLLTYHDNNDIIQDKVTRMRNLNCRTSARGLAEILSLDD